MKWVNGRTLDEKKRIRKLWHKWFAWYPVVIRIENGRKIKVWLEYVEISGEYWQSWYEDGWDWEYREMGSNE